MVPWCGQPGLPMVSQGVFPISWVSPCSRPKSSASTRVSSLTRIVQLTPYTIPIRTVIRMTADITVSIRVKPLLDVWYRFIFAQSFFFPELFELVLELLFVFLDFFSNV